MVVLEVTKKDIDVVSIPGNGTLLLHEPKQKVDLTKYLDNQVFHFDYSFDESSTNDLVYRYSLLFSKQYYVQFILQLFADSKHSVQIPFACMFSL